MFNLNVFAEKSLNRLVLVPNRHTTSNPHRFNVDITSIRRRPNFHEFPRHFHVLFWCNSDSRKIHVVSTYLFFDVISLVEKSTLFSRTFFDIILMVEKSTLSPRTFFDAICLVEICKLFLLSVFDVICNLMKTFEECFSCVCNFKQLTFSRLFSLKFLSKSARCSPVLLKFEWYNLHHCQKNCR